MQLLAEIKSDQFMLHMLQNPITMQKNALKDKKGFMCCISNPLSWLCKNMYQWKGLMHVQTSLWMCIFIKSLDFYFKDHNENQDE